MVGTSALYNRKAQLLRARGVCHQEPSYGHACVGPVEAIVRHMRRGTYEGE